MITDTHAHVWWESFDEDRRATLVRARAAGVSRIVLVGTDVESSRRSFELSEQLAPGAAPVLRDAGPRDAGPRDAGPRDAGPRDAGPRDAGPRDTGDETSESGPIEGLTIYPTAGIHPHDAEGADAQAHAAIEALCRRDDCVAVGETGLDFFKEYSPRAAQEDNFRWHLALCAELKKPIIVHSRDAHERTCALLAEYPDVHGVMHCYTMGTEELPAYLELGYYISFSGVVTYPKNDANRAAARAVPGDRLLVETDCPFLAPQGHRGKRNEPALVRRVLECVAHEREVEFEALAEQTTANAERLFNLAPSGMASGMA